jgi:hypothetical protein
MISTRLLIIILTFLLTASSVAVAADTLSFPNIACKGSESSTCTENNGCCYYTRTLGNAPFFDLAPIDETKCHSDPVSKRTPVNKTFIVINKLPTRVKPRQPHGIFVQTTGSVLLKGHCIVSCDWTHLHYAACSIERCSWSLAQSTLAYRHGFRGSSNIMVCGKVAICEGGNHVRGSRRHHADSGLEGNLQPATQWTK